jgi:hypothetical protein
MMPGEKKIFIKETQKKKEQQQQQPFDLQRTQCARFDSFCWYKPCNLFTAVVAVILYLSSSLIASHGKIYSI